MKNGKYETAAGSTVTISGKHSGIFDIAFDWVEEKACFDCKPEYNYRDHMLEWSCTECGGGSAELTEAEDENS